MVDLINRRDAVWVLCKETCTPGPICPDTLCQEMWDKFKDVPPVELTPCDLCKYDPPGSEDGKPCGMCPSDRKSDDGFLRKLG